MIGKSKIIYHLGRDQYDDLHYKNNGYYISWFMLLYYTNGYKLMPDIHSHQSVISQNSTIVIIIIIIRIRIRNYKKKIMCTLDNWLKYYN